MNADLAERTLAITRRCNQGTGLSYLCKHLLHKLAFVRRSCTRRFGVGVHGVLICAGSGMVAGVPPGAPYPNAPKSASPSSRKNLSKSAEINVPRLCATMRTDV